MVHGGGITHLKKVADFAALYHVRTGCHGATDLSPVCMAAALHFGTAIHNFGIQEHMPHTDETDAVFPHRTLSQRASCIRATGRVSVSISMNLAARYPYQRAYLPVNRKLDGTLTDW